MADSECHEERLHLVQRKIDNINTRIKPASALKEAESATTGAIAMSVIDALSEGQVRAEEFRDELGKVRHVLDTDAVLEWQTRPSRSRRSLEKRDEPCR